MEQRKRGPVRYLTGGILFLLLILLAAAPAMAQDETVDVFVKGRLEYQKAYQVLTYTNQVRAERGVEPLAMDKDLMAAAMQRAAEISILFAHDRPDGTDCYSASPKMSGENIAAGQRSASAVVTSWKNSPGHYANMIEGDFRSVGIGCFNYDGTLYWVQCFGRGSASAGTKPADKSTVMRINLHQYYLYDARNLFITGVDGTSINALALKKGDKKNLTLLFYDGGSIKPVELLWKDFRLKSSNPAVLTVDGAGNVKGVKAGTAVVTISHPQYPGWSCPMTFKVSDADSRSLILNANGGSLSKTQNIKTQKRTVTYKKKYGELPTPVRKGYTFKGWYTGKSGGSKVTSSTTVQIAKGKTQTLYARWSKITVKKASITKLTPKSGSLTVKWAKVSGAKGYEVFVSTSKKFTSGTTKKGNVTSGSKISGTFKNLRRNTKYYVRVRAYTTDALGNKIYGSYSTVKSIRVK
ncbi:CAP domain-containing protein [Marvinbryantia formatexigens]|nr:CAP domain-containing protein [Marvinbryantia formatexigens]UWO26107.1 CAP domain-containing protein [Marvinbryantia formatexigens DSM 14469]SDF91149.1 Listeria/Bacterioides repeat-containing protein [Marvinbryantia formatexigens]